jgi:hypothetical protein
MLPSPSHDRQTVTGRPCRLARAACDGVTRRATARGRAAGGRGGCRLGIAPRTSTAIARRHRAERVVAPYDFRVRRTESLRRRAIGAARPCRRYSSSTAASRPGRRSFTRFREGITGGAHPARRRASATAVRALGVPMSDERAGARRTRTRQESIPRVGGLAARAHSAASSPRSTPASWGLRP